MMIFGSTAANLIVSFFSVGSLGKGHGILEHVQVGLSYSGDPQVFQHTLAVSLALLLLVALLESYPYAHNKT